MMTMELLVLAILGIMGAGILLLVLGILSFILGAAHWETY